MKVGLVMGAGGVLGGAWLTGGLDALARETRWDPGSAEYIVGTSAGSMIGALIAAGVPPWFMVAHSRGEVFDGLTGPDGRPAADADRAAGAVFRVHRGLPAIGPGSLRMAFTALRNPLRHTPLQMLAGWIPAGFISTDSLKDVVRRAVPDEWVDHPNYWAVACDYESGRRIPFGRLDSPQAEIAEAVAASCAIPGFYRPVRIGGRRYVDGGVCSVSNLDVVAGRGLDLVICLNPLTSPDRAAGLLDLLPALTNGAGRRRLAHEERKVRRFGTEVVVIEPSGEDLAVMGRNWMNAERRQQVIETARRTVAEQLRGAPLRALLADLPQGEPHKIERPAGPPSTWPELRPVGRRSAA
ncbi:MAG: patatin-like phospholipase family protein [Thermoleophilaceae bacterium]